MNGEGTEARSVGMAMLESFQSRQLYRVDAALRSSLILCFPHHAEVVGDGAPPTAAMRPS
ncbi:hypothetical protein KR51_00009230 [Rubidibacter lacunae KORDI 51-2]|uniref:Uncharacterized protein n=1 Tax=Rubidibacter lacunae KORDI 51-2 TaxID=582515 RepID=U5DRT3_9CHRO|nr:hypothetical protein KR51_00009230 [Rubidibacter lacunae KORDI 51-2]